MTASEKTISSILKNFANICNAMDAVSIQKEITNTKTATTTHEITF